MTNKGKKKCTGLVSITFSTLWEKYGCGFYNMCNALLFFLSWKVDTCLFVFVCACTYTHTYSFIYIK